LEVIEIDVNVDQLADAIVNTVRSYTEDVSTAIDKEVDNTTKDALAEVKRLAPKKTGEYAKGFTKVNKSLPGNRRYIVWNKKYYSLVHLLEHGHAKVGGGRVQGYPHMGPATDRYVLTMPARIADIIRNGG